MGEKAQTTLQYKRDCCLQTISPQFVFLIVYLRQFFRFYFCTDHGVVLALFVETNIRENVCYIRVSLLQGQKIQHVNPLKLHLFILTGVVDWLSLTIMFEHVAQTESEQLGWELWPSLQTEYLRVFHNFNFQNQLLSNNIPDIPNGTKYKPMFFNINIVKRSLNIMLVLSNTS